MFVKLIVRKLNVFNTSLIAPHCSFSSLTQVTYENGVKTITLSNPKKRNALSSLMLDKLHTEIYKDVDDKNLRCIILRSEGPVFSSGHDLKELKNSDTENRLKIFQKCSDLMIGLQTIPVPIVSVVNGLAAAAGCQLVASCDIAVATTKSQFSTPGASVGLFCSTPGIAVSRNVPLKVASYMLFTGNNLSAAEAVQSGLISKAVEEQDLELEVEKIVQAILSKSRSVLELGKKFFYSQLNQGIGDAYSCGNQVMVDNLAKVEAEEGIAAFFEKRPPKWTHI